MLREWKRRAEAVPGGATRAGPCFRAATDPAAFGSAGEEMKLHRCPGLTAWITVRTCELNRTRSTEAKRVRRGAAAQFSSGSATEITAAGVEQRFLCCNGCPGVRAIRAGTKVVDESALVPLTAIRDVVQNMEQGVGADQMRKRARKITVDVRRHLKV